MKTFVKCEFCKSEISGEKCIFAIYERKIHGEELYFCCENHLEEFEKKQKNKAQTKEKKVKEEK